MTYVLNLLLCIPVLGIVDARGCIRREERRKLRQVRDGCIVAALDLPRSRRDEDIVRTIDSSFVNQDTLFVKVDGKNVAIMHAEQDERTGEMVAIQSLAAAVVSARFRNVAERRGKVDIEFEVKVPVTLLDPSWQLRLQPLMVVGRDTLCLDKLMVTGNSYRRAQLKGYQHYERFLSRIVSDSTKFVDLRSLEIFLKRNIPRIYRFRSDSTVVSDQEFASCFGVTEKMAVEHFTNKFAKRLNHRRASRRHQVFNRYVKSPIIRDGVRLDSVINSEGTDFIYNYLESVNASGRLRKVDIYISGEIYESDRMLYSVPRTGPLTFYISSLSSLSDGSPHYLTRIVERRVEANASWNIGFRAERYDVDPGFADNESTLQSVEKTILGLLEDKTFDIDSISIAAFASPEGTASMNSELSVKRGRSVVGYFNSQISRLRDSLNLDSESQIVMNAVPAGENWDLLDELVMSDTTLAETDKRHYRRISDRYSSVDRREAELRKSRYYRHLRDNVYPSLRTVRFDFHMHRRGMVKDTLHTTELDTLYMKGLHLISEREYEAAAEILLPYGDYNSAVALLGLERNRTAEKILESLPRSPNRDYLLAIVHSRTGNDRKAVECYLNACRQDGSLVHRGNLDPEIASLIRKYKLDEFQSDNNY